MSKNLTLYHEHELSVRRLTSEEKRWVSRLARVLADCPERLQLMTHGDMYLYVIDGYSALESQLCDGNAYRDGVVLASVKGPTVHGVSG